jgi:hypothetical protein
VFDTILYSGNNSTQSITSLAFNPDMVWSKCRNVGRSHRLSDAIRGSNVDLYTDTTASDNFYGSGSITAFTANGFNLDNSASSQYNTSGETYVSWCWDAGTSTVTNTQGSITSQVRANATAGFSVVTFTAPSSGSATIGHGLGVEPYMVIIKSRDQSYNWCVYHKNLTSNAYFLNLNTTAAQSNTSNIWNNTTPTSTVFSLGGGYAGAGATVAYCFSPVVGYSSFGSYVGNGSATDGPFVYTGMRPRWILIKSTTGARDWLMWDTARDPYNVSTAGKLSPNLSDAEYYGAGAYAIPDVCSNGFKIRVATTNINANGETHVYAAFAEMPFNYSRAR